MRKNYFQNVKIADKLKMVMKAIFAILLVNNILFAILMLVFGHPVWIIIPVIAVVGMPLLSKKIIQELTQNILEPLEKAADDMAHGNLEIDISYQGEDELGKLAESFRNTSFYLRGVVGTVFVEIDTLYFFCVNISGNVWALVYYNHFLSGIGCLSGKYRARRSKMYRNLPIRYPQELTSWHRVRRDWQRELPIRQRQYSS